MTNKKLMEQIKARQEKAVAENIKIALERLESLEREIAKIKNHLADGLDGIESSHGMGIYDVVWLTKISHESVARVNAAIDRAFTAEKLAEDYSEYIRFVLKE